MRFRLLLLLLPLLLVACSDTNSLVKLDFIGAATLTSGSQVVNPSDTLTTRVYAVGNANPLRRLRITVTYEPGLNPFVYPSPLSSFDPKNAPKGQEVVYLDSLISPKASTINSRNISEFLFVNKFTARSTSGTERWQYTATDANGESASRAYLLTARKPDSAALYHSYTTRLRAIPRADTARARVRAAPVFLNLRFGLLLPKYAITTQKDNQKLVDLIGVTDGSLFRLSTPADVSVIAANSTNWPSGNRRAIELRRTGLSTTDFNNAVTTDAFTSAFEASGSKFTPNEFTTGALQETQVIAFKVTEESNSYYGLLLVSDLILGTSPILTCAVKVQK